MKFLVMRPRAETVQPWLVPEVSCERELRQQPCRLRIRLLHEAEANILVPRVAGKQKAEDCIITVTQ